MNILKFAPDKNNTILKYYHKSNKALIPLLIPSFFLDDNNQFKKYFDLINLTNISFHSYVSISCVITDYHKKIPLINETILRSINLKSHTLIGLVLGYQMYIKYYKTKDYHMSYLNRYDTLP